MAARYITEPIHTRPYAAIETSTLTVEQFAQIEAEIAKKCFGYFSGIGIEQADGMLQQIVGAIVRATQKD